MSVKPSNITSISHRPAVGIVQKPPTEGSVSQRRKAAKSRHMTGTAQFR